MAQSKTNSIWDSIPLDDATGTTPPTIAPAPVETSPPNSKPSIWDDIPAEDGSKSDARAKATGTTDAPDNAAKVFNSAVQTNTPAQIIRADFKAFENLQNSRETQAAIDASPDVANYISRVPGASAISQGDWHNLIDASGHLKLFDNSLVGEVLNKYLGPDLDTIAGAVKSSWDEIEQSWRDASPTADRSVIDMIFPPGPRHLASGVFGLALSPTAPVGKYMADFLRSTGIPDDQIEWFMGWVPWMLGPGAMGLRPPVATTEIVAGPPPRLDEIKAARPTGRDLRENIAAYYGEFKPADIKAWSDQQLKDYVNQKTGFGSAAARAAESTGETPAPGVDEVVDQARVAEAKMHAESMDKMYEVVQAAKTTGRSADAMEAYLNIASAANAGKSVWLPSDKLVEIYGGVQPRPDDDLFGYVPNINERLATANELGSEISVPLAKYLAHTKEGPYGELKDFVRLEDGLTPDQAKTWIENIHGKPTPETAKEELEAEIVGYHGTAAEVDFGTNFDLFEGGNPSERGVSFFAPRPEAANVWTSTNSRARQRVNAAMEEWAKWTKQQQDKYGTTQWRDRATREELITDNKKREAMAEAGKPPEGAPGERVIPVRIRVKPDKMATYDLSQLFAEDEDFQKLLHEANTSKDVGAMPRAWHEYSQEKRDELWANRLQEYREQYQAHEATRARILAEEEKHDIGPFKISLGTNAIAAAILKARREGMDVARLTNLIEHGEQIIVLNPAVIHPYFEQRMPPAVHAEQLANILLNAEKKSLYISSIFEDEKAAGMSRGAWNRFSQKLEAMDQEGYERALKAAQLQVEKQMRPSWQAERNQIRDQVQSDVFSRGDIAANRFYRFGELPTGETVEKRVKFDRATINAMVGEDALKNIKVKGGVHPDDEATRFGYKSGRELIQALMDFDTARGGMQPREFLDDLIDQEADARMASKHGSMEEAIAEAAQRIALEKNQIDVLIDEYKQIAMNAGKMPLTLRTIQRSVNELFGRTLAKDATYQKFKDAAYSNAVKVRDAALKGKWDEALQWEEKRLRSLLAAKQAREHESLWREGERLIRRFADNPSLANVDQHHVDWAHEFIANLKRGPRWQLSKDLPDLEKFIDEHNGSLLVANWLRGIDRRAGIDTFNDLNVDERVAFIGTLKSLMHNGKMEKLIDSVRGRAEEDNINFDIKNSLQRLPDKRQPKRPGETYKTIIGSRIRSTTASYIPVTAEFDYIDQMDPSGPLATYVTKVLHAASIREVELTESVAKMLMEGEKYRDASLHDTIDQDVFWDRTDNHWMAMDRQMLREVMGYRGSESGTEKLMGGYDIDDISKIDHVIARNATANDFAYVNLMYQIQDKLWDLGAPMEERITGVVPDKIEPRSVEYRLSDGSKQRLDGGYWQVKYDGDTVFDITRGGIFDQQYQRVITTPHKWVIPRTQFMAPLDLSGAGRVSQLMTMIHDIAFREPVLSIARLLRTRADPEHWRMTYARKLGAEKNNMLDGWLADLANSQNFNRMPTRSGAKALRIFRQNVEAAYTFLNPSIILKHVPTATATSALETGVRGLFKGAYDIGPTGLMQQIIELAGDRTVRGMAPDPNFVQAARLVSSATPRGAATRMFIYNKSAFMRERGRQYPETLHAIYDDINTPEAWRRWLRAVRHGSAQLGRFPVALGDSIFADATWLTEYNRHMAETGDDGESVYMADRAVLRSHGGPFQMDKPGALNIKGNDLASEFWKSMTMFQQFWNRNFVGIVMMLRDIGAKYAGREEPGAVWSSIMARLFVRVALVAAWDEVVRDLLYPSKRSLSEIVIGAILQTAFGWHTLARNIVQFSYGHEPTFGAMGMAASDVWNLIRDLERAQTKGELGKNWLMHLFTAISVGSGIGGPQLGRTTQGFYRLGTGQEQPETPGEALRILQQGSLPRGE